MTTIPTFMDDVFLSFRDIPYSNCTLTQKKHWHIFLEWCNDNNYCSACTLYTQQPVSKDNDIIPNCPHCDSYYYEEFQEAQKNADLSASNQKLRYRDYVLGEINIADLYYY